MKKFNIWLEEREEAENITDIIFTALFSDMDPQEAKANMDMKLSDLDTQKVHQMLEIQPIRDLIGDRDPKPLMHGSIQDFINWLIQPEQDQQNGF